MELQAENFLEEYKKVLSWLPKVFSQDMIEDILANFWLYPKTQPTTEIALTVYQAKLRVELSKEKIRAEKVFKIPEKIISNSRNFSEALLIFLDGVQPKGVFDIEVKDFKLATCFCFDGKLTTKKTEEKLADVTIDFGIGQKQKIQIIPDQIVTVPVGFGFSAQVTLKVHGGFQISGSKKFSGKVTGSQIGLVFDARGRPIIPPGEAGDREKRSESWIRALEYSRTFKLSDF